MTIEEKKQELLFRIFQRSQLNSNSQQRYDIGDKIRCCFEYFKDLN